MGTLTALSWIDDISAHLTVVLLATWATYVYRDIWPLATFYLERADYAEGSLFWAKFAVLSFAAIIIPLALPRRYVPYDLKVSIRLVQRRPVLTELLPQNPMPVPNKEQTASIFSMTVFEFMTPLIWAGYRTPQLTTEQLPPLRDDEYIKNMAVDGFFVRLDYSVTNL